ncbi:hypothetical protein FAIPA1_60209 [Frankia sp. AiPs1]
MTARFPLATLGHACQGELRGNLSGDVFGNYGVAALWRRCVSGT